MFGSFLQKTCLEGKNEWYLQKKQIKMILNIKNKQPRGILLSSDMKLKCATQGTMIRVTVAGNSIQIN
jgi:hypothetical protein